MPRMSLGGVTTAFERVQRQARSLLGDLRVQIRAKENELRRLKEEETRLSSLLGGAARTVGTAMPARRAGRRGGGGGRVNWREIFTKLPKQFKAADVRKIRGVKSKRPSEVFAAITRWIEAGMAKRKARG